MEIEELIRKLKKNPEEYLKSQSVEYIDHLLYGALYRSEYESNQAFYSNFHSFVAKWANIDVYTGTWYHIFYDKSKSDEEAVSLFYTLCDDFFKSYHNGDLS